MTSDLPVPEFGRNLIENLQDQDLGKCIIVTQEVPWGLYGKRLKAKALDTVNVTDMGFASLQGLADHAPECDTVLALGGGMAIDAAKFMAWNNEKRLISIPTAISADVSVCRAIAIRDDWKVRYIGDKMPERLLIDYDIIQSAPVALNRGGVCDILSCYTALQDWEIAHADTGETSDQPTIDQTQTLLDRLFSQQREIHDVTEAGIRFLVEGYLEEVRLCEALGSPRPEEGSEHFFAYNLEYRLRRSFVHGCIVPLGVVLMTILQERSPDEIVDFLDGAGVPWRPAQAELRDEDLVGTIETLYDYCVLEDFYHTVINHQKLDRETALSLVNRIKKL